MLNTFSCQTYVTRLNLNTFSQKVDLINAPMTLSGNLSILCCQTIWLEDISLRVYTHAIFFFLTQRVLLVKLMGNCV